MRDRADNVVIVCSIENIDPMGVHTGDSRHRRAAADADRPPVPAAARPGDRRHPRRRRRDRRLQRPVRGQPGDRRDRRHRDEPARVALVGAGVEGDRLPDRQDRRAARGRLHARRDPQRHHARSRRRRFEPTIDYVVVKWPRFAFEKFPGVDAALSTHMKSVGEVMAIGRTFRQAFAQGDALARARRRRADGSTASCSTRLETPGADRFDVMLELLRRGVDRRGGPRRAPAIDPWFLRELRELALDPEAPFAGVRTLQGGRHLRRRVRGRDAVLLLGLGAPAPAARGPPRRQAERDDPRLRPEPDRPGDRVRLLLRARRDDRARVRPRRGDGQLQPGDGLDRLRHLRPPVLRAADARGRARRSSRSSSPRA